MLELQLLSQQLLFLSVLRVNARLASPGNILIEADHPQYDNCDFNFAPYGKIKAVALFFQESRRIPVSNARN